MDLKQSPINLFCVLNFLLQKAKVLSIRPNKKRCVFLVTGLKILGMVGTHFFSKKNIVLCILKGISPFKMHKIIFFSENLKKFYVSPEIKVGPGYAKTQVFIYLVLFI